MSLILGFPALYTVVLIKIIYPWEILHKIIFSSYPELQLLSANNSVPTVDGSGDIIFINRGKYYHGSFSCPPGLALIGPNLAICCTENGEWEPDPSSLLYMCTGKSCLISVMKIHRVDALILCAAVACENLLLSQSVGSSLYILDYSEPAVVGTTISLILITESQMKYS